MRRMMIGIALCAATASSCITGAVIGVGAAVAASPSQNFLFTNGTTPNEWIIPASGVVKLVTVGGGGGASSDHDGGAGAVVTTYHSVSAGSTWTIRVGGGGTGYAGGSASSVWAGSTLLSVAGGGGGANDVGGDGGVGAAGGTAAGGTGGGPNPGSGAPGNGNGGAGGGATAGTGGTSSSKNGGSATNPPDGGGGGWAGSDGSAAGNGGDGGGTEPGGTPGEWGQQPSGDGGGGAVAAGGGGGGAGGGGGFGGGGGGASSGGAGGSYGSAVGKPTAFPAPAFAPAPYPLAGIQFGVGGTQGFSPGSGDGLVAVSYIGPGFISLTPSGGSAEGGTQITITGVNLDGANLAVTVGGAACTVVGVPTSSTATCMTTATSSGTSDVVISTVDGSVTAQNAFTFTSTAPTPTPTPSPTSGSNDPNTSSAVGAATGFRVRGSATAAKYHFHWMAPAGATASTRYSLIINQRGRPRVTLVSRTTDLDHATVSRKAILKSWRNSRMSRGDSVFDDYLRLRARLVTSTDTADPGTLRFKIRL